VRNLKLDRSGQCSRAPDLGVHRAHGQTGVTRAFGCHLRTQG